MASGTYFPLLALALWASGYSPEEPDKGIVTFPRDEGLAYIEQRKFEKAIEYYTWEIDHGQATPGKHYNRGRCHLMLGDSDKALADFNATDEMSPGYYETHWMRGETYKARGEHAKALKDYNRTLAINPKFQEARIGRGETNLELGNYDAAVADLNIAVQVQPSNGYHYLNRAKAYEKLGRQEEAEADRAQAQKLLKAAIEESSG